MVDTRSFPTCEQQQVNETTGILYVASGDKYLREAEVSARSVKRAMPHLSIALVSDLQSREPGFDHQFPIRQVAHSFIDKIAALKQSPFQRTLFLDSDTNVLQPLGDIFTILDRFDIAAALEPARYLYQLSGVPDSFPELNTGVILYRKSEAVFATIDRWLEFYQEENERKRRAGEPTWHDQLSFTRAIWQSALRLFILPPEWNYRAPFPQYVSGPVKIFHGRLKDRHSDVHFVNRDTTPRIFCPNPRRYPSMLANTLRLFRLLYR
jgi:hypothetical protein